MDGGNKRTEDLHGAQTGGHNSSNVGGFAGNYSHDQRYDRGGDLAGGARWQNGLRHGSPQQRYDHLGRGDTVRGRGRGEYYGGDGGRSTTSRGYRREYHDNRKYESSEGSDHWSGGNNHVKSSEDGEAPNSHGAHIYVRGERSPMTERRQRHFQATGHQYHRYSQTQRARSGAGSEREQGRVCALKDSFGFVRCIDRPGDLFFHLTEAPHDISIGDEVDFTVGTSGRSGKDCALELKVLPPGTVMTDVILEGSYAGFVERDTRSFHFAMSGTQRAQGMSRPKGYEHQQVEGLIKIINVAHTSGGSTELDDDSKTEDSNGKKPAEASGHASGTYNNEVPDDGDEMPDPGDDPESNVSHALAGVLVSYGANDALEGDTAGRFRRGDEVNFRVSQEKSTGRKRAVEITLIRTARERREEEQLQKLITSGATRQQGVVKKVTHEYGFLQSLSGPESVYFNTCHVAQGPEGGERLRPGSQADFWVVPDRDKDGRDSYRALDVRVLPPGTLELEEEMHTSVQGVVEKVPTIPQRPNFGGGNPRDGAGGVPQPGSGRFSIPQAESTTKTVSGEESERVVEAEDRRDAMTLTVSLHPKELGKSGVPLLELGDVIEADIWRSKMGGRQYLAKNVRLVSFGGSRDEGIVRSIREGGFGFIRPLDGGDDLYFRMGDVCKNLSDMHEGSEVLFTVKESERGDRKRAIRVEVLPKGTLQVDWRLASGVSGVVTRDIKGSTQGIITVMDGNSLELPIALKFRKVAKKIHEFSSKVSQNELVFPATLGPAERNAAHRIAAAKGLRHESRGDTDRFLHIRKPKDEQEVAEIVAAEAAREEERAKAANDRSKNGERSLSVPFCRGDIRYSLAGATDTPNDGKLGGASDNDSATYAQQQKHNFEEGIKSSNGSQIPHRGDLVAFDVVLNRATMKRRATNIKVTKRSTVSVSVGSNGTPSDEKPNVNGATAFGRDVVGIPDKVHMGIVSLVQTERHYGFIDVAGGDERIFFHLSEVVREGPAKPSTCPEDGMDGDDRNEDTDRTVVVADVCGERSAASAQASSSSTPGTNNTFGPVILRGQEVAFRLGHRQGRRVGLSVRKLPVGSLSLEETILSRYVGVVVVAPRGTGSVADNSGKGVGMEKGVRMGVEQETVGGVPEMEGMLVVLDEKTENKNATATSSDAVIADGGNLEGDARVEVAGGTREIQEASKAQRMLSSAGLGLRAPSTMDSRQRIGINCADQTTVGGDSTQEASSSSVSGPSYCKKGRGPKGPSPFAILRFTVPHSDRTCPTAIISEGAGHDFEEPSEIFEGIAGFERGDLVEFSVLVRRGLRQGQGHQRAAHHLSTLRADKVSLLKKSGLRCRRGTVAEVDAKGMATVELTPDSGQNVDMPSLGSASKFQTTAEDPGPDTSGKNTNIDHGGSDRVFFLLKEMVGVSGHLRHGDEVEFFIPTSRPTSCSQFSQDAVCTDGAIRAVGAVKVQDLRSLSAIRQRLNTNLRDSQKGPWVRMAQGPDGEGFKPGHRTTPSLYASVLAPSSADKILEALQGSPTVRVTNKP